MFLLKNAFKLGPVLKAGSNRSFRPEIKLNNTKASIRKVLEIAKTDIPTAQLHAKQLILKQGSEALHTKKHKFDLNNEIDRRLVLKTGANKLNHIVNNMLSTNEDNIRELHLELTKSIMQKKFPHFPLQNLQTRNGEKTVVFRHVRINEDYGMPSQIFDNGMSTAVFPMFIFQGEGLNLPYIKDGFHEKSGEIGWTGGGISTSANIAFVANCRHADKFSSQKGYVYAIALDDAYVVADGIHHGVGSTGKNGKTNAENAREYLIPTYAKPENIIAAREVEADGSFGRFIVNPRANDTAIVLDSEFHKLKYAENIKELELYELIEQDLPDLNKKTNLVNELHRLDGPLETTIKQEARNSQFHSIVKTDDATYLKNVKENLDKDASLMCNDENRKYWKIQANAHSYYGNNNKLLFDQRKAKDEAELKRRILSYQKNGLPEQELVSSEPVAKMK